MEADEGAPVVVVAPAVVPVTEVVPVSEVDPVAEVEPVTEVDPVAEVDPGAGTWQCRVLVGAEALAGAPGGKDVVALGGKVVVAPAVTLEVDGTPAPDRAVTVDVPLVAVVAVTVGGATVVEAEGKVVLAAVEAVTSL